MVGETRYGPFAHLLRRSQYILSTVATVAPWPRGSMGCSAPISNRSRFLWSVSFVSLSRLHSMLRGVPSTLINTLTRATRARTASHPLAHIDTPPNTFPKMAVTNCCTSLRRRKTLRRSRQPMLSHHLRRQMRLTERAIVVGITRASYTSEDGFVPKASDTSGDGRVCTAP